MIKMKYDIGYAQNRITNVLMSVYCDSYRQTVTLLKVILHLRITLAHNIDYKKH